MDTLHSAIIFVIVSNALRYVVLLGLDMLFVIQAASQDEQTPPWKPASSHFNLA